MVNKVNRLLNSILDIDCNNSADNRQSLFKSTIASGYQFKLSPPPPLPQEQKTKGDTRTEYFSHPSPCLPVTLSTAPGIFAVTERKKRI